MGTFDCWRGASLAPRCALPDGPVATGGRSVVATGGQPWGQASAKWSSRIRRISRTVIGLPWVECPECSITSSDHRLGRLFNVGIDVSIRGQIMNQLEHLQQTLGVSYLFIGHDLATVAHISDRIAVM